MKVILLALSTLLSLSIFGQGKVKLFEYKKGEVLDVIFLRQKEDTEKELKTYFDNAIPLAMKNGYQPGAGFSIEDTPLQGNYHPQSMLLGKWNSIKERKQAMETLEKEVDDFHKLRRVIWANFDMTYYEVKNDLSFEVQPDMYNVTTAYWFRPNENGAEFVEKLYNTIKHRKGNLILSLANGESPNGYHHDPDLLLITAWKNKKAFEKFKSDEDKISHYQVSHVNQFRIN